MGVCVSVIQNLTYRPTNGFALQCFSFCSVGNLLYTTMLLYTHSVFLPPPPPTPVTFSLSLPHLLPLSPFFLTHFLSHFSCSPTLTFSSPSLPHSLSFFSFSLSLPSYLPSLSLPSYPPLPPSSLSSLLLCVHSVVGLGEDNQPNRSSPSLNNLTSSHSCHVMYYYCTVD